MDTRPTRHLDLGCGSTPRNPYGRSMLFGVDLSVPSGLPAGVTVSCANLALEPIPFPESHFDSVSAYDFLEHMPRVLALPDGKTTRLPFVELMNEIWRVLAPGGLLYALTPAYPHPSAFQDPTHVNVLTVDSHEYFTQPKLLARIYGFRGDFAVRRVHWVKPRQDYEPPPLTVWDRLRQGRQRRRGELSHLVWELEARK
jgi:SAM-dependent methyltransferase